MPHPTSMSSFAQSDQFEWRKTLAMTTAGALVAPVLQIWFDQNWTWADLVRGLVFSLVYSNSVGIMATAVFVKLGGRLYGLGRVTAWALVVAILVFCAAAGCLAGSIILHATGIYQEGSLWTLYVGSFQFCLPICLVIGILMGIIEQVRDRLRMTELQLRTKELERERAEKLATEARLSSLESRIHPHFLFNTLNSISSLVREDPERAERLIERMASLLRFSLDANESALVPLERELKVVCDYLEIETARFGDRLRYSVDVPEHIRSQEVPPLSVQTLVENSVKYAVATRREGGCIEIVGRLTGDVLKLTVRDDGPGFTPEAMLKGHGLDLLQSRLETQFGARGALTVDGSAVSIQMPARSGVAA